MYRYNYGNSLSSRPRELTAPNGFNFVRSVGVPTSRLERVREYLRVNGPRTKRDILRDVFGIVNPSSSDVRGYHVYVFTYGVRNGFFTKERKGNVTYWNIV